MDSLAIFAGIYWYHKSVILLCYTPSITFTRRFEAQKSVTMSRWEFQAEIVKKKIHPAIQEKEMNHPTQTTNFLGLPKVLVVGWCTVYMKTPSDFIYSKFLFSILTSDPWGRWIQFWLAHIFQMGWNSTTIAFQEDTTPCRGRWVGFSKRLGRKVVLGITLG